MSFRQGGNGFRSAVLEFCYKPDVPIAQFVKRTAFFNLEFFYS